MATGPAPPNDGAARRPLTQVAIDVPATAERLQDVHDALARFWAAVARHHGTTPSGSWRAAFETAVAEVAANIVRHAYPGGAAGGTMRFRLHAYPDAIEARFADHGIDFRPHAGAGDAVEPPRPPPDRPPTGPPVPDGLDDLDGLLATADLAEGGYGLPLARAALDTLDYSRSAGGENEWWLVKRLPPPEG
jgi:serine/threonine-protein kinase RsbW